MINVSVLLISVFIFIDTIAYGIYEFKNENKFAAVLVFILAISMIIFVNISMFNFK